MPASMGSAALNAAARSAACISVTRRPMNTGISVSISATTTPVANIAANSHFVCRTKCQ